MGVLTKTEIEAYLRKDELLSNPRLTDSGAFDIQPDSYDLTAGKALWKDSDGNVSRPLLYDPSLPPSKQESRSLRPGEMVFVITHEDILMPKDLCGTVYTKNRLAMDGILALNAGHVDPGYNGPIVIRLINIRSDPWVLTMGKSIFTIVFQTLNEEVTDGRASISEKEMLEKVNESASNSLGNALYDLSKLELERRLLEHQSTVEEKLRGLLAQEYIRRTDFWSVFFATMWSRITAFIVFFAIIAGIFIAILTYFDIKPGADSKSSIENGVEISTPTENPNKKIPTD